jgi:hypothetical protein
MHDLNLGMSLAKVKQNNDLIQTNLLSAEVIPEAKVHYKEVTRASFPLCYIPLWFTIFSLNHQIRISFKF